MRFRVSWPDGKTARVDTDRNATIVYTNGDREHLHGSWHTYRALLVATGATIEAFSDGERWPEDDAPWPVDPSVRY